ERPVSETSGRRADDIGPSIAVDVGKRGRLVIDGGQRLMPGPVSLLPRRIFVPVGRGAGETQSQDVRPAVPIEVVTKGKEVVRIAAIVGEGPAVVELVPRFVVRSGKPIR